MNKLFALACLFLLLTGCALGGDSHKPRVHKVTDYHHQLVVEGKIALEGYVYGVEEKVARETYVFASEGTPKNCNGGEKFVLDPNVSIWVTGKNGLGKISYPQLQSRVGSPEAAYLSSLDSRDKLRRNLPMIFSSEGCN